MYPNRRLLNAGAILAEPLDDLQDLRDRFTIGGKPTMEESPFDSALTLNGATPDYVAKKSDLIKTGNFSIIIQIKNSQTLVDTADRYLIVSDKETFNGTKVGWSLLLQGGTSKGLSIRLNDGTNAADYVLALSTDRVSLLSDNKWHLVAATIDRGTIANSRLYVDVFDGEVVFTSQLIGANTLSNDQDLVVGGFGDKTTWPFTGGLKDLTIFPRIISAQEVFNFANGKIFG